MIIPSIKNFESLSWAYLSLYHLFPGIYIAYLLGFSISPYFHSALAGETLLNFRLKPYFGRIKVVPLKSVMVPYTSGILVPVKTLQGFNRWPSSGTTHGMLTRRWTSGTMVPRGRGGTRIFWAQSGYYST